MRFTTLVLCTSICLLAGCRSPEVDSTLMTSIDALRAIDNHSHVVAPDLEHDTAYDAIRCEIMGPGEGLPRANLRFGPDLQAAWKALYDFTGGSIAPDDLQQWSARQKAARERLGAGYFAWVLDQAGLETVLANRVSMAADLTAPRFRWVSYDDALLVPLDNTALKRETPDRKVVFEAEEELLREDLSALGLTHVPATLAEYLDRVVEPTLQARKRNGAVAIKFEVAYLRSLDFQPASRDSADQVYARFAQGGVPADAEYKTLQDFLFRDVAARAGRIGLVAHIHTGTGCGDYFDDRGADPMLLAPALNDPALRRTSFVLLHGGSPFDRHITSLIVKPNVWVDMSALPLIYSPDALAAMLRPWLETMPEHILFGIDAGPSGPGMGWEETTWIGNRKARRALGIALTRMMREDVISRAQATDIAERVLRQNALDLYRQE